MAAGAVAQRPHVDVEQSLALIEKGQQMAGHFPSGEDLEAARKLLAGEVSREDAFAELDARIATFVEQERAAGRA